MALGSRILGGRRAAGRHAALQVRLQPLPDAAENLLIGEKLSEYHTGYRAFSRRVLETLPLEENDDDFVFDNQMLVQAVHFGFRIAEVTCPTPTPPTRRRSASGPACEYGFGVLDAALQLRLARLGLATPAFLSAGGRRLPLN